LATQVSAVRRSPFVLSGSAADRERPVLLVPPPIGRFYFLDLRPGRSFIEYSAGRGLQTFLLSWRNPGQDQRDWDLDTYAARVLRAIDAIRDITGSGDVNTIGFCVGGIIITTGVVNHLAATRPWPPRWSSSAARAHAGVVSILPPAEILIAAARADRMEPGSDRREH
jgi:poly(3-hydroxyalkanoate) synthetase